ncbi:MAG: zinc ribbon domain-containing protein [Phycisphaerae bacterium]|nr:zinc ribbon domain-containing protein [Phycisphaerae bacterium]
MMLAETTVFVVFFGLFVIGLLAFIVAVFAMVLRVIKWTMRGLFGGGHEHPAIRRAKAARFVKGRVQCSNSGCGYLNRPEARYCGGCGRALAPARKDVDAYG